MTPRPILLGAAAAAAALGLTASSEGSGARPAAPATPLLSYVASNGGVCLIRPDGSHAVRVTPRRPVWLPRWSPRGRYVAYEQLTGPDQSKLVVADARGRVRWMFGAGSTDGRPLWSPDGSHIAYFAGWAHIFGISIARPDGSDDHEVASSPAWPTYGPADPAWTADGQRLAFDDGDGVDGISIFSVAVGGGDRRELVADATQPAFSPDGSKLAYVGRAGVVVAAVDGAAPQVLSSSPQAIAPAWSPDGSLVAFDDGSSVVVARPDGSGARVIGSGAASFPAWSPDGKLIAFLALQRTNQGTIVSSSIVVAAVDGSGQRTVVRHVGHAPLQAPTWRARVALPVAKRRVCPRH